MKKIVILGGGFGGVEFYRAAHKKMHGSPDVRFEMISDRNYFLFYPMLHEVATGSVERSHITQPLREIVRCCTETFQEAQVTHIDVAEKRVRTSTGEVAYDFLVIALGVRPNYFGIPGASEHCISFQSIADAVQVRNHLIHHFEKACHEHDAARRKELLSFLIIGGGPTGVELAGQIADLVHHELRDLYREIDFDELKITLIDASDRLLRQLHPSLAEKAKRRLEKMGVTVILNALVEGCTEDGVTIKGRGELRAGLRMWAAGMQSNVRGLVDAAFVAPHGGIATTNTLQLINHPEVFVVGDAAEIISPEKQVVPQTAQAATSEAVHAAKNLYRLLAHQSLETYVFKSKGDIVPIGDWFAVAEVGPFRFSGRVAWVLRRTVFLQRIWSPVNRVKILFDWNIHALLKRDTSQL